MVYDFTLTLTHKQKQQQSPEFTSRKMNENKRSTMKNQSFSLSRVTHGLFHKVQSAIYFLLDSQTVNIN